MDQKQWTKTILITSALNGNIFVYFLETQFNADINRGLQYILDSVKSSDKTIGNWVACKWFDPLYLNLVSLDIVPHFINTCILYKSY